MGTRLLITKFMARLVLLFPAAFLSACTTGPAPDPGERDAAVSSIMQALHSHDKDRLVQLGPKTADPHAEWMLSQWGGVKDSGYVTGYTSEYGPDSVAVRVGTTDPAGRPVNVDFALRWNDSAWVLDVGPEFPRT
jgi:hypothetical protein